MNWTKIIPESGLTLLCGAPRSGKSLVANAIANDFARADKLLVVLDPLVALFPFSERDVDVRGVLKEFTAFSERHVLPMLCVVNGKPAASEVQGTSMVVGVARAVFHVKDGFIVCGKHNAKECPEPIPFRFNGHPPRVVWGRE